MFARLGIGTRILSGFMVVVALAVVVGGVGWFGIRTVSGSLHMVGDEEAPLVDQALDMKINMMAATTAMDEYQIASTAIASTHADELPRIVAEYEAIVAEFDRGVTAMLEGGRMDDGSVIEPTDNENLARSVREADAVHNDRFQPAAARMMEAGQDLLAKAAARDAAMTSMETAYEEAIAGAALVEQMVARSVNRHLGSLESDPAAVAEVRLELPLVDMASEAMLALSESRIRLEEASQTDDAEALRGFEAEFAEDTERFDACVNAALEGGKVGKVTVTAARSDMVRETLNQLQGTHTVFESASEQLLDSQREMIAAAARMEQEMGNVEQAATAVSDALQDVVNEAQGEMAVAKQHGYDAVKLSTQSMFAALIVALVAGVGIGLLTTRWITGPLGRVVGAMRSGSDQVTAAAGQVATASQEMAAGASAQAASLEEASAALEELSRKTGENAESSDRSSTVARDVLHKVRNSSDAMQRMAGTIEQIKTSSDETSKIIKTIDEIAFQTNLLALNAAVEAARAGDAGKGFAVVAEEVRNLAQRSAEAAKDTSGMIDQAQKYATDGVTEVEGVVAMLQEVVSGVTDFESIMSTVADASREQRDSVGEITSSIAQVDQVTQASAASSEETASASEELSAQATDFKALVGDLVAIMEGAGKEGAAAGGRTSFEAAPKARKADARSLVDRLKRKPAAAAAPAAAPAAPRVAGEQVIPFDDADVEDLIEI
jgi:methyl-accepting chemotaxis protein